MMSRKNSFLTPPASTASSPTKITCRKTRLQTTKAPLKTNRRTPTHLPSVASCNQRFWTSSAPPWSPRPRFLGVRWGWGRGLLTPLLHRTETESVSSVSEPDPLPSDHKTALWAHCSETWCQIIRWETSVTCIWITASVWSSAVFAWASKTNGYLHMVTWESMTCTKQRRTWGCYCVSVHSIITSVINWNLSCLFIIWNVLQMIHHLTKMQITKQKQTYWNTKPLYT